MRALASAVLWPFRTVWLVCPGSEIGVFGWKMHWLVWFFAFRWCPP